MPELAEVEYYRQQWEPALGQRIEWVHLNAASRCLRNTDSDLLLNEVPGQLLRQGLAHGKQMCWRMGQGWLGIHLGMAGRLFCAPAPYVPHRHDHLILFTSQHALVFNDYRMFGEIRWHSGPETPLWWQHLPPSPLEPAFSRRVLQRWCERHARLTIKGLLLRQDRFPGVGNWMADEILWRARLHPARLAGELDTSEFPTLHRRIREVCRDALRVIAGVGGSLPPDLNVHIPATWLFQHRWRPGGRCPRCQTPLKREKIAGRTSCWCETCLS